VSDELGGLGLPEAVEEPPAARAPGGTEHAAGDLRIPSGMRIFGGPPNGARRSVGIAVSRFNGEVTSRLLEGALGELDAAGVAPEAIEIMPVPGAFELPLAAMALAKSRRYSCVLAIGCVIRGETPHFDYVSGEAASGVQLAGLETGVPVAFGVLTCDSLDQAEARAGGSHGNKGAEAARSALEMVESLAQLRASLSA
jgi:6,7-dimethyl-8-ribityllumazine synthase